MAQSAKKSKMKRCTVTLSTNGKVTIPKGIREQFSARKGDSLELYVKEYEQNAQVITEV